MEVSCFEGEKGLRVIIRLSDYEELWLEGEECGLIDSIGMCEYRLNVGKLIEMFKEVGRNVK